MNDRPRWLVLRRGGLGDTLLMAPVLRALARAHPDAMLDFAGVPEFGAMLQRWGLVERVLSSEHVPAWRLAAGDRAPLDARLRDYAAIVADDPAWTAWAGTGCAVHTFSPAPRGPEPLPMQIAAQLGARPDGAVPAGTYATGALRGTALRWPEDAWFPSWRAADAAAGEWLLAPGSGGVAKCWPRAHWLTLARALAAAAPVSVVVGPVERERGDPRAWPWPVPVRFVVEPDVRGLADRCATARAFVGNDSGPTHLAAMSGTPTVALFGPSVAAVYGPTGPRVELLLAPNGDLAALSPDVVHAAAARADARRRAPA